MAFKPNRKIPGQPDLDKLRTILNNTHLSNTNNPLYQFCNSLLLGITTIQAYLQKQINDLSSSSPSSSPSRITASGDYLVLSDGATPIPEPVNDGFGNFIYITYTP